MSKMYHSSFCDWTDTQRLHVFSFLLILFLIELCHNSSHNSAASVWKAPRFRLVIQNPAWFSLYSCSASSWKIHQLLILCFYFPVIISFLNGVLNLFYLRYVHLTDSGYSNQALNAKLGRKTLIVWSSRAGNGALYAGFVTDDSGNVAAEHRKIHPRLPRCKRHPPWRLMLLKRAARTQLCVFIVGFFRVLPDW